ncbi:hypothetical protein HF086_016803 [Spodoptera exigua]|uniref:Uncharacterized protein n=1 Tax=Spodoptera exigua TaxID=7107 RepID=A0A922SIP9_SPOEX|nr:hypothetical protein HF086_016803 [Spodoptera exigua]
MCRCANYVRVLQAGDAASYYSQWKDTRLRVEHYINAEEQGHIAGANMAGYWIPCNMEPNYWVKLGEMLQMEVVGEAGACLPIVGLFKDCSDEASIQEADELVGGTGKKRKCFINKSILRAKPTYHDINLLAELLGFPETHCVYKKAEEIIDTGPCLTK